MHIAIEGCAHGELESIYKCISDLEIENNIKIELLICCGDFQSARNEDDLRCMAVPRKYYNMCSFYKYYSGQLVAPVPTIFIGGNHEASNYLQELPFGGWVAPNIFYLGYAGVVNFKGLRIGGISGIYKANDYYKGHYEQSPYDENTKRSVYHIRNVEVFRLKQIREKLDIFLSHDWPTDITKFGNEAQLLNFKPYFQEDIESGKLGSPPCKDLLFMLKPSYWFAAHLHCKFSALVPHDDDKTTKFLALDKCLPRKRFLQVLQLDTGIEGECSLEYDLEWLTILQLTSDLFSTRPTAVYMPSATGTERWQFLPTEEEKQRVLQLFGDDLRIPANFMKTASAYIPGSPYRKKLCQPNAQANGQTKAFCAKLLITDPTADFEETANADAATGSGNENANASHSKRKCLRLPDAVNSYEAKDDVEADKQLEEGREIASESLEENSASEVTGGKENKKLKRRNASIYNSTD